MTAADCARRTALVTGGAAGIGAAVVRTLAQAGIEVLCADIDRERGAALAGETGARFVPLDVADPDAWAAVDTDVDYLCLNAGVSSGILPLTADRLDRTAWERARAVNLDGLMNGVLRFAPAMLGRTRGSIVVTASLAGLAPFPADPLYSATKHFAVGLVRSLAEMYRTSEVRVNAVCPDSTITEMTPRAMRESMADELVTAEDVASTIVDLLLGERTGEVWAVTKHHGAQPYRFRGYLGRP